MKKQLTIRADEDGASLRAFCNNLMPQFQLDDNILTNNNNTLPLQDKHAH